MKIAHVLCLSLSLFAIAACGTSIKEACEEGCDRTCDGADPLTADEKAECKADCATLDARIEKADCGDQADELQSCSDDYVCDPEVSSACSEEATSLARCFANYCADHPDDEDC